MGLPRNTRRRISGIARRCGGSREVRAAAGHGAPDAASRRAGRQLSVRRSDSSLVASLGLRAKGSKFTTFSLRFEDAEDDETPYQRQMAAFARQRAPRDRGDAGRHRRRVPGRGATCGASDPPEGARHPCSCCQAPIPTAEKGAGAVRRMGRSAYGTMSGKAAAMSARVATISWRSWPRNAAICR